MHLRAPDEHYTLLQAFDLAGQRLFQSKWAGNEAFALPEEDPNPILARRAEIERELVALRKQLRILDREREEDLSEAERNDISQEGVAIIRRRRALTEELATLPDISAGWEYDFAKFERRQTVEGLIREALHDEKLCIILHNGLFVPYKSWLMSREFRISFPLSLVIPSREDYSGPRRAPAYFLRLPFDQWLGEFAPDATIAGEKTAEEKCRLWLREHCTRPKGARRKSDFLHEAQTLFPDLSARAFERVWAATTPADWKTPRRIT